MLSQIAAFIWCMFSWTGVNGNTISTENVNIHIHILAKSQQSKEYQCLKDCTSESSQVCASNGKTYDNPCLFEIASCQDSTLTIVNQGPCSRTCNDVDCTRELEQVCASDGKTYDNRCLFEHAKCFNQNLVLVNDKGPCR